MIPARGDGLYMQRDHYGTVICPHCSQTAQKGNSAQITCGRMGCRQKQNLAAARKRKARERRLAAQ